MRSNRSYFGKRNIDRIVKKDGRKLTIVLTIALILISAIFISALSLSLMISTGNVPAKISG